MKNNITHTMFFLAAGLGFGILSKLLDIHTEVLGNIFSEFSVWILLGTLISIYSKNPRCAAVHVFMFCIGMLAAYYVTAWVTNSVYAMTFVYGWCVFTMFCPAFAWITWYAKEKTFVSKFISAGILMFMALISVIIFDGPRFYDFIIAGLLIYFLFIKKVNR